MGSQGGGSKERRQPAGAERASERERERERGAVTMNQLIQSQLESNLLNIANTIEQSLDDEMHRYAQTRKYSWTLHTLVHTDTVAVC